LATSQSLYERGDVEGEPRIVVRREADDQPAVEHLDVDALAVHVGQSLVEIGGTGGACWVRRRVDRHAPPGAFLCRVELVADLRDPLAGRLPGGEPSGMQVGEFVPRERVLVDVCVRVDHQT